MLGSHSVILGASTGGLPLFLLTSNMTSDDEDVLLAHIVAKTKLRLYRL